MWVRVAIAVTASLLAGMTSAGAAPLAGQACDGQQARAAVTRFVAAFNRGDLDALDALFADESEFVWLSSGAPGQRSGEVAKRRSSLRAYFRARHEQRDRLRLTSFGFNGNAAGGGYGNLEFALRRSARDYGSGGSFQVVGKGAVRCNGGTARFIVLSIGGDATCPVTLPGPPGRGEAFSAPTFNFGTAELRAQLYWWRTGEILAGRMDDGAYMAVVEPDGSISAKVGWWRGLPGSVRISIQSFAGGGPLSTMRESEGYGELGFQPSMLVFPSTGCWRVTGTVATARISFVLRVSLAGA